MGDALQQWRSRLAVTGDSVTPAQDQEEAGGDLAPEAEPEQQPSNAQGDFEYMAEGQGRAEGETQALAPATEDQAKANEALDQTGLPDQDADDVTAAAEAEAQAPQDESAERMQAEQSLSSSARGNPPAASLHGDMAEEQQQQQDPDTATAEPQSQPAAGISEAEAAANRLDDSYVSAQLQRASLSDGAADGKPDEDMVLAEGGLTAEAAQQLRQDVEQRVKAASEGTLQLDTSEESAVYGREVSGLGLP